jgi:hypothetical protein
MISLLLPLLLIANPAAPMTEPDAWMPVHEMHLIVVDVDGKPLQGVTVSINPVGDWRGHTSRSAARAVTNAEGRLIFTGLPGGSYDVKIEISGFLTSELPDIPVRSAEQPHSRWIPTREVRVIMNELAIS